MLAVLWGILMALATPAITEEIRPNPGPQEAFLATNADICIYGGAAGGGKTFAELLEPVRHKDNPNFHAVIFRRTYPQITAPGGLWPTSQELYPQLGAEPLESKLTWRWPSGATVQMRHLQHEKNVLDWQGSQVPLFEFDELTHFTERQFWYMLSRNRSTCGVRPYIRAATNPDPFSWVRDFIGAWVNADHPDPAESGEIRHFVRVSGEVHWSRTREDLEARFPALRQSDGFFPAKTLTFIQAKLSDNPKLLEKDPGYLANLMALPLVDRLMLLDGKWDVLLDGNFFKHAWLPIVQVAPTGMRLIRHWDIAATEPDPAKNSDPDWTAGVLVGKAKDTPFIICDVGRLRGTPGDVEATIFNTAMLDRQIWGNVEITLEQEPGAQAKAWGQRMVREVLAGFNARVIRPEGSKIERAKPYSAQAEAGNVKLLAGHWNKAFIDEHLAFPNPQVHDDQVDGASGAIGRLIGKRRIIAR